ncbi:MAG: cytidine deaminase [Flavihumibacter sp.]
MSRRQLCFEYELYESAAALPAADKMLLEKAKSVTGTAYAPYSNFRVGAAAVLDNGDIVTATNQENASYPVGICAERTLLSAVSATHPGRRVVSIAISYSSEGKNDVPISPCGLCRQTLVEYEHRFGQPIRLILGGKTGPVYTIASCALLLPFGFTASDLHR